MRRKPEAYSPAELNEVADSVINESKGRKIKPATSTPDNFTFSGSEDDELVNKNDKLRKWVSPDGTPAEEVAKVVPPIDLDSEDDELEVGDEDIISKTEPLGLNIKNLTPDRAGQITSASYVGNGEVQITRAPGYAKQIDLTQADEVLNSGDELPFIESHNPLNNKGKKGIRMNVGQGAVDGKNSKRHVGRSLKYYPTKKEINNDLVKRKSREPVMEKKLGKDYFKNIEEEADFQDSLTGKDIDDERLEERYKKDIELEEKIDTQNF